MLGEAILIRQKYGNLLQDFISFDLFFSSVALNYTGLKSGGSVQEGVERDKAHDIQRVSCLPSQAQWCLGRNSAQHIVYIEYAQVWLPERLNACSLPAIHCEALDHSVLTILSRW